ncbi:hypothetical protein KM043_018030 [Ampulex compressa]|nr:hypothetical protein KM043_018030 [Ampulex compressa]
MIYRDDPGPDALPSSRYKAGWRRRSSLTTSRGNTSSRIRRRTAEDSKRISRCWWWSVDQGGHQEGTRRAPGGRVRKHGVLSCPRVPFLHREMARGMSSNEGEVKGKQVK